MELKAIEDVLNEFLIKNHLSKILNPVNFPEEPELPKPNIDSIRFKVFISDALLPIAQIKEDNEFLFLDTLKSNINNKIFQEVLFSDGFKQLRYREFDKSKFKLIKPYIQIYKMRSDIDILKEEYARFSFSRVCFDNKNEYGILYMNYFQGYSSGGMGQDYILLIKNEKQKWSIVYDEVWKSKFGITNN